MSKTLSDEQLLLKGIAMGDEKVIRHIYTQYHKSIVHFVETHHGTLEDAKDIFQEGMVLLFQKSKDPNFELKSSFFTYFYAVCRNIWFNRMRKKSFGEVTLTEEMKLMYTNEEASAIEQNEQDRLYRKHFKRLGKDCQRLLSLFFDKISMVEIAKQMGFSSESYAKKRKFQCKQQLVAMIEEDPLYSELKY